MSNKETFFNDDYIDSIKKSYYLHFINLTKQQHKKWAECDRITQLLFKIPFKVSPQ